jgi:ABC-type transport system substrate-binding protein
MVTRSVSAVSVALLLVLAAGCASNNPAQPAAPAPSSSEVVDLPLPSTEPSTGKPAAGGAQTITGTVTAGVEPNCLLLNADGQSHLLIFDDPALKSGAAVGQKVTLVGRSEPSMMSTCQQGVPFIVSSIGNR